MERHRQLTDARESESNQLQHLQCADLRRLGRAHLRLLERQIVATIDTLIEKELETQHQGAAAALRAVPGIGLQSAALLLAELPELGQSEQRRDRALAAVAPFNHDSGPWRGTRHIRGGRGPMRRGLWMATLVAVRHHPALPRVLPTPAQQREASQSRSHRRDGNSSSSSMPSCDPSISRSPN